MRKPDHQQPRLFYSFCPESLIPEDHPLASYQKNGRRKPQGIGRQICENVLIFRAAEYPTRKASQRAAATSLVYDSQRTALRNTSVSIFYTAGLWGLICKTPSGPLDFLQEPRPAY